MIRIKKFSLAELFAIVYLIWSLMPLFLAEYSPFYIRIVMTSFLFLSILCGLIGNGLKVIVKKDVLLIIGLFLFYIMMSIFDIADANSYINVVITFWSIYIMNKCMNVSQKKTITIAAILILSITFITSTIGVISDNSVSRTIAHAMSDDNLQQSISKRNIAGIYLFQSFVCLVPSILIIIDLKKKYYLKYIFIIFAAIVLFSASYTISIFVFVLALILYLIYNLFSSTNIKKLVFSALCVLFLLFLLIYGINILNFILENSNNTFVNNRIIDILSYISNSNNGQGDVSERINLYDISWSTFVDNLFSGIGPHYSFIKFENGIGYHSQILDDLARFGILSLIFYVPFFCFYIKDLMNNWKLIGKKHSYIIFVPLYIVFLFLNIGFRSSYESVMMFIVIVNMPLLFYKEKYEVKYELIKKSENKN